MPDRPLARWRKIFLIASCARHGRGGGAAVLRAFILRTALLAALWWALTGGRPDAWPVGAATVALAAILSLRLQAPASSRLSVAASAGFLAFFLARSLKGGVQVAAMAIRPRLDLQPAILDISLRLPQEAERIFLVSMLSLLPGTLSVGLEGQRLQLHVLDRRWPIEQDVRNAEARIARMFRVKLP